MAILAPLPFVESLAGKFVYDDHLLIEEPASVHSLRRLGELWKTEFWGGLDAIHFHYLRPLVSTSYAVDWAIGQGHPLAFHLTNLGLHAAVSVMLYACLSRWSGSALGALLATLAWAWHPSKVEVVSWIAGRTDLWCAFGILVACAGVKRRLEGARGVGAALEIVGLLVALASKEHGVVAPAFVAVEAWAYARREGGANVSGARAEIARAAWVALPSALCVAAYLVFRFAVYPIAPQGAASLSFVDARLYTLETLGEFARVVFFPFHPSIQHAPIRVDDAFHVIHDRTRVAGGIALIVGLAVGLWIWKKRGPAWRIAGCLLGLVALAPVANVTAAKMVFLFAERFVFIPLMGFALCAVPRRKSATTSEAGEATPRRQEPLRETNGASSPLWPRPSNVIFSAAGLGWRTLAPWAVLLIACAAGSFRHTRDFLDDRHLWEHELAENPMQPLALRFACQEAMHRQRYREALALAMRGYEAARGWPVPQPDRVEFALRAARSLESITLDANREALAQIEAFYDAFFGAQGEARLDVEPVHVAFDARGGEARHFRRSDPSRLAEIELWRAVVASRLDRCDIAAPGARAYLTRGRDAAGRVNAVLVLGRCGQSEEALDVARALDQGQPSIAELVRNLQWIAGLAALAPSDRDDLDASLRLSRARAMLLDRGGAYRALVPWRDVIAGDEQGAMFFARAAWAAGEDDAARSVLAPRMSPAETETLLTSWSRELGR